MHKCHDTFIHWFLFKEEPSYNIDFGPKNGCDVMLNQAIPQLKAQARYHGDISFSSDTSLRWNNGRPVFGISQLIGRSPLINKTWEEDFAKNSFTLTMFPPNFEYGDLYFLFDSLRFNAHEDDNNTRVIECISELIRYAHNLKHWLCLVRTTYRSYG